MPIPERILIPGVVVVKKPGSNSDQRRDLIVIANSDDDDVPGGQIKALHMISEAWLGGKDGHYHSYPEMYGSVNGPVDFYLQSVADPALKQMITIEAGERLTIPAGVAHKVFAHAGTTFVGVTAVPYSGPQQDVPFEVETTKEDV